MRPAQIAAVAGLTLLVAACASSSTSDNGTIAQAELPPSPAPPPPPPPAQAASRGTVVVTGARVRGPDQPLLEQSSDAALEASLNKLPQSEPSRYAYVPPI